MLEKTNQLYAGDVVLIPKKINYEEITFVIPSLDTNIPTLNSIPKESDHIIRFDDSRGKARNEGVKQVNTEYIVFADSDIDFSLVFLEYVTSLVDNRTIVGLQGYYPSPFLISRFMIFKKSAWEDIGPLCEVQHGEETEWCIRAIKKGYKLLGVPRESVYHHPHIKSEYKKEYSNLLWLIKKHPTFPIRVLKSILYKMKVSNYEDTDTLKHKEAQK